MIELYLVRHGQTDANLKELYYGASDIPLNTTGHQQAQKIAHLLDAISFNQIICSGLIRTQQTAQIINHQSALPIQSLPALNELDFGDWELMHRDEMMRTDADTYQAWCHDWLNVTPPHGEAFTTFKARIIAGYQSLTLKQNQKILIVGHLGVLRVLMTYFLNLPTEAIWHFNFKQDGYSCIQLIENHFIIDTINQVS